MLALCGVGTIQSYLGVVEHKSMRACSSCTAFRGRKEGETEARPKGVLLPRRRHWIIGIPREKGHEPVLRRQAASHTRPNCPGRIVSGAVDRRGRKRIRRAVSASRCAGVLLGCRLRDGLWSRRRRPGGRRQRIRSRPAASAGARRGSVRDPAGDFGRDRRAHEAPAGADSRNQRARGARRRDRGLQRDSHQLRRHPRAGDAEGPHRRHHRGRGGAVPADRVRRPLHMHRHGGSGEPLRSARTRGCLRAVGRRSRIRSGVAAGHQRQRSLRPVGLLQRQPRRSPRSAGDLIDRNRGR